MGITAGTAKIFVKPNGAHSIKTVDLAPCYAAQLRWYVIIVIKDQFVWVYCAQCAQKRTNNRSTSSEHCLNIGLLVRDYKPFQGPILLTWINLNPSIDKYLRFIIHSQTSTMQQLKFGSRYKIPSHTLLGMQFCLSMLELKLTRVKESRSFLIP